MRQDIQTIQPQFEGGLDNFRPKQAADLLLWSILAFLIAFIAWSALTKLDRTVRGAGRVVSSARLQTVSNLEGGIVGKILVQPGQLVKANQQLVLLDPTQSQSELNSSQSQADALGMRVIRLTAEIEGREPQFPQVSDPSLLEQIRIERALHASRLAELAAATAASQAQFLQAQRQVGEASAGLRARLAAESSANQQLAMIRPLVERGVEPRMSLVQANSAAAVAQADVQQAREALARAQAGVSAASAALGQMRSDWRSRAATELAATGIDKGARDQALPALEDQVNRRIVRAPMSGRVNRVLVSTLGGTVRPGEPIVELVPFNDALVIEANVAPKDIAFVRIGQRTKVSITAYDAAIYGALDGKVTSISPDAVVDQHSGQSYFIVRVATDQNALKDSQGHALPIGPGMIADVALLGDKRSILAYILTPITRLAETAFRE